MTTDSGKARAWTPGPWSFEIDGASQVGGHVYSEGRVQDGGDFVCMSPGRDGFTRSATRWEANARLIAAAPALFEALDRLLNVDAENLADVIAAEHQARAALASAQEPQP